MVEALNREFLELNVLPDGIPLRVPETFGGLGLPGTITAEEEELWQKAAWLGKSAVAFDEGGVQRSAVYKDAVSFLSKTYGTIEAKDEEFRLGVLQWGFIDSEDVVSENTATAAKAQWDLLRTLRYTDAMRNAERRVPTTRVPAVIFDDNVVATSRVQKWSLNGGLWEPNWGFAFNGYA
jgi:hypothetical protein